MKLRYFQYPGDNPPERLTPTGLPGSVVSGCVGVTGADSPVPITGAGVGTAGLEPDGFSEGGISGLVGLARGDTESRGWASVQYGGHNF